MLEIPTSLRVAGRDYQIVQRLGRGTFGEVYRTRDDQGREFALKLLAAEPAPSRLSSFKNEFLLLTQIKHPYLCAAHGFDYSPALQRYLFVFDYAPGQSFFEATSGKSSEEIEPLALMVLEVLDHLHLHEVVHFDIKCPNIIVTPEGSIKLLDLGLARRETVPLEKFPGSLLYAAPEILVRSRSADHRADLYSLGIVLYRALTRHFPFDENDPSQIIEWHLRKGLAWAPEESEKIPHYLRQLIEFLLRKSPAERLSQARAAINWVHLHTGHRYRPSGGRRPATLPSEGSLIAREKEIVIARDALAASSGKTLLFLGERGIGKSRLLREIRYMAEVQEFHCLWFDRSAQGNALSQLARQLEAPLSQAPDEFFRLSLKALALSEKLGDLHNILILLDHLIGLSQRRAEYDRALRYFSKATDYRSLVSPPYQIAQNELKGAFLYLAIGLPEPARFCLERIEPLGPQAVSTTLKGWIALAWGYYHRARGESEKAALKFQESLAVASPKTDPSLSSWGYYALADLRREEKNFKEAVRISRQASQTLPLKGNEELRLRTRLLGLLLQKEGSLPAEDDPLPELGRLARQCESEGMPEIAAEAYRALGDPRADEIYEEIASHLPEEYRLAYRSDRRITRER